MNRYIYIFSIIFILTSCAHGVVSNEPESKPIIFQATVNTKGYEVTDDELDHFYATALTARLLETGYATIELFFKNVEFARLGDYFYSNPQYYRPANRPMSFIMYYPSEDELGSTFNWNFSMKYNEEKKEYELEWEYGNAIIMKNFSPNPEISNQKDFLFGFAEMLPEDEWQNANGEITTALLYHTLSQIEIQAKTDNTNQVCRIAGVKIANVISKADLLSSESSPWILDDTETSTYIDEFDNDPIELGEGAKSVMNPSGGNAFLLPQSLTRWDPVEDPKNENKGAYISVKLQVADLSGKIIYPESGQGYVWRAIPIYKQDVSYSWCEGEHYIYTLNFTAGYGYDDPQEISNN